MGTKSIMILAFTFSFLTAITSSGSSKTIKVPGDYAAIQQAIDASVDGDTVLVDPGTYAENIDFKGKAIRVTSSGGAGATVIDGSQADRVVFFQSGEGLDSIIEGFTLTNGNNSSGGGGVACLGSSPTIRMNDIQGNKAGRGGGVFIQGSPGQSPLIEHNRIRNNEASDEGKGIAVYYCSVVIMNNEITGNFGKGWAGGILFGHGSDGYVAGNVIQDNLARLGGGICLEMDHKGGTFIRNIIRNNHASECGGGLYVFGGYNVEFSLSGNLFSGNTSRVAGGGLYLDASVRVSLANNMFHDNSAGLEGGGLYADHGARFSLFSNNTLAFNSAGGSGGGIFCDMYADEIEMSNSIFWDNAAPQGPEISVVNVKPTLVLSHSDVRRGKASIYIEPGATLDWGPGMIESDPLFVRGPEGDIHLTYPSPCRDSGDNGAAGLPDEDFEGDPRMAHGTVDMGADEFHTHLYYTGEAVPGLDVDAKIIGLPFKETMLCAGTGLLDPPLQTKYGQWYLALPVNAFPAGAIPWKGVVSLRSRIPPDFPVPSSIPLQAFVRDELTNLCVMELK